MQRELIPWTEIDPLIDHLVSQIDREIDVLLTLNPGGIVPGGILAEALRIDEIQIASIENRKKFELKRQMGRDRDGDGRLRGLRGCGGREIGRAHV